MSIKEDKSFCCLQKIKPLNSYVTYFLLDLISVADLEEGKCFYPIKCVCFGFFFLCLPDSLFVLPFFFNY